MMKCYSHLLILLCLQVLFFLLLESLFPESSVEQGLEAMFNMDSLGHNEEIESAFDCQLID